MATHKLTKVNLKQKNILFDAICRNGHILDSIYHVDPSAKKAEWRKLVAELNKHGREKSIEQWKKCWRDLRASTRKKYLHSKRKRIQYMPDENEQLLIKACGLDFNQYVETKLNGASAVKDMEVVEHLQIKEEQPDEGPPDVSEMLDETYEKITNEFDIKIENEPVGDTNSDSSYSLIESLDNECNSQDTKGRDYREETLKEIKKMHRNLLRESKKQTELMKQLLNKLTR